MIVFPDKHAKYLCVLIIIINFTFTFMYAIKILQVKYYIRKNILIYSSMVYLLAIDPQHYYTIRYMYMYMYVH